MKILFINLADQGGLGNTSVMHLRKKYGEENVTIVNLMTIAKSWSDNLLLFDMNQLFIPQINDYDEIIFAAHGLINDIDSCYTEKFLNKEYLPIFTTSEAASFFNDILTNSLYSDEKTINLQLCICYGARTSKHDIDHIENKDKLNFSNTFAGRFINSFHCHNQQKFNINMSSYTGSISFNFQTGELEVETEEQIRNNKERIKLLDKYSLASEEMNKCVEIKIKEIEQNLGNQNDIMRFFNDYYNNKIYLNDQSALGSAYRKYYTLQREVSLEQLRRQDKQIEYGKVLFKGSKNDSVIIYDTSAIRGRNYGAEPSETNSCRIF